MGHLSFGDVITHGNYYFKFNTFQLLTLKNCLLQAQLCAVLYSMAGHTGKCVQTQFLQTQVLQLLCPVFGFRIQWVSCVLSPWLFAIPGLHPGVCFGFLMNWQPFHEPYLFWLGLQVLPLSRFNSLLEWCIISVIKQGCAQQFLQTSLQT